MQFGEVHWLMRGRNLVTEITLVTDIPISYICSGMRQTMILSKRADKKKEQKSQMNKRPHAASA